jgi:hypothetical protein
MPEGLLVTVPVPVPVLATVSWRRFGSAVKLTVTLRLELSTTRHVLAVIVLQAPVQLLKT